MPLKGSPIGEDIILHMNSFINSVKLNKEQYEAVNTTEGALLILAGAGSGKTRVLTHRIAHLILDCNVQPFSILAITFTNKAANEMKERVASMCADASDGILVATFHSACVRILRRDIEALEGYSRNFTIFDDDDTGKIITQICNSMNIDIKQFPVKMLKSAISNAKNSFRTQEELSRDQFTPLARLLPELLREYERGLKKNNALDFDDLILKTLELFDKRPDILEKYQNRFRYIMVDEYQDTNASQYRLVKYLGAKWKNVCVVGDDDQSIYSWRGADISIIRNFKNDYKDTKIIKLEQNYRSTGNILNAANAIIKNNPDRTEKHLWSELGQGEKISLQQLDDDRSEAAFIARIVAAGMREGASPSDFAVLYRVNSISRNIEAAFMSRGIPFRIYGGHRFYERAEIKDALAYLRVIVNSRDEVSLRRIINVPKRGIGQSTVDELSHAASLYNEGLFSVAMFPEDYGIKPKTAAKLEGFISVIEDCAGQCAALPPADAVRYMLERTGLTKQYSDEGSAEAAARADNLNELINDAAQFTQSNPDGTLEDYLEQVTLVNDIEAADEDGNGGAVNMMTVHSAKGLEFKNVFIAAFEDGIFPINRAFEEKDEMEEERRLAYVAVTRAKRKLYITCARQRMSHGYITESLPSRFIREIPEELLERTSARPAGSMNKGSFGYNQGMRTQYGTSGYGINRGEKRPSSGFSGASSQTATRRVGFSASFTSAAQPAHSSDASFRIGECVMHRTFGHGRIIGVKGSGADQILQIAFEGKGIKELSAAVAPIEKI